MCGIFAYLNYLTPKTRKEIVDILINGLKRLEYRGYDSAGKHQSVFLKTQAPKLKVYFCKIGIGIDEHETDLGIRLIKKKGKVKALQEEIDDAATSLDLEGAHHVHCGIAHTRWATHGVPSEVNSHPHRSGDDNEFIVVHNGILTNYKDVKVFLQNKGYEFESDTDTEVIAKLIKHLHSVYPKNTFRELVEKTIQQLEGAFACCFKSKKFPGECVGTRRGSPLLVGIKTESDLVSDSIPIQFSPYEDPKKYHHGAPLPSPGPNRKGSRGKSTVFRVDSHNDREEISPSSPADAVEYFFASDASAIIEHTDRVIFLEDDDVAAIQNGVLTIHRIKRDGEVALSREVTTLKMEIQEIMKGSYSR